MGPSSLCSGMNGNVAHSMYNVYIYNLFSVMLGNLVECRWWKEGKIGSQNSWAGLRFTQDGICFVQLKCKVNLLVGWSIRSLIWFTPHHKWAFRNMSWCSVCCVPGWECWMGGARILCVGQSPLKQRQWCFWWLVRGWKPVAFQLNHQCWPQHQLCEKRKLCSQNFHEIVFSLIWKHY